MNTYYVELAPDGKNFREVSAEYFQQSNDWIIFYKRNPCGGPNIECIRVAKERIIAIKTLR